MERRAPLKIDPATDELISQAAHFLGMTKKDLVGEAVRVYLELRRTELREAVLAKLRGLDGSVRLSRVFRYRVSPASRANRSMSPGRSGA
jgi:hypothetical protein